MIEVFLKQFKRKRRQHYFENSLFNSRKAYACVGVGMHSLNNIYPILHHFNIKIKYVVTKQSDVQQKMQLLFAGCICINDISIVLADKEVEGIFVCTDPEAHFEILQRLLQAQKNVFVEKPPCKTVAELEQLASLTGGICKVGLQRRYWPANKTFRKKVDSVHTYNYRFRFGKYIEGDVYTELFIHPLDYCSFLFGDFKVQSFTKRTAGSSLTIQMLLKHEKGISGLVELSTAFSWNAPVEQLEINCTTENITVSYPLKVSSTKKPLNVANLPLERLRNQPEVNAALFSGNNLLNPVFESNTLYLQGFLNEIKTFVDLVEGRSLIKQIRNDLPGLINLYKNIETLKK